MKHSRHIAFEFVDMVPSTREEGTLYISIKYRTAVHNCFCGCGMKVVTPIRPTGWRLIYDGDRVTLYPSIGNWSFQCRSHYWIRESHAIPAGAMSTATIEPGRQRDRVAKDAYYSEYASPLSLEAQLPSTPAKKRSFWDRLFMRK